MFQVDPPIRAMQLKLQLRRQFRRLATSLLLKLQILESNEQFSEAVRGLISGGFRFRDFVSGEEP